ncbi:MAG: MJ0042-type zinc finger domain-containing protein [Parvibaculum sp.]|uniref:MJ0042-type zinc finger domain-containing protein n=1 Tax=Parvibaculum sp. TaxID=2024848 RepID=UPI0034A03749
MSRMIITCPSCSTRYPVEASSFAPAGRKVRCAKCGQSWHQAPPADLDESPSSVPPPAETVSTEVVAPAFIPASTRKKIFGEKAAPAADALANAASDPDGDDDVVFADTPVAAISTTSDIGNRFRAQVRRAASMRRGKALNVAGWVTLALFVGGTLMGGYQWRADIASFWPATTRVYAAVGAPVNLRGLEFRNVAYERQEEQGLPVLAVTGEVVNVSGKAVALPRLRIGLRDVDQTELYHWTFALDQGELPADEATTFTTRLSSPPVEARDIEIRFVREQEDTAAPDDAAPAEE